MVLLWSLGPQTFLSTFGSATCTVNRWIRSKYVTALLFVTPSRHSEGKDVTLLPIHLLQHQWFAFHSCRSLQRWGTHIEMLHNDSYEAPKTGSSRDLIFNQQKYNDLSIVNLNKHLGTLVDICSFDMSFTLPKTSASSSIMSSTYTTP